MNWLEAVEAMRQGHIVRRKSEMFRKVIEPTKTGEDDDGHQWASAGIIETGQEGCYLAHAWTADEKPAQVFMGASSKVLFVPDGEHREATDWIVVERGDA